MSGDFRTRIVRIRPWNPIRATVEYFEQLGQQEQEAENKTRHRNERQPKECNGQRKYSIKVSLHRLAPHVEVSQYLLVRYLF